MTVEEPKTTDAEGAESTPATTGDETETAIAAPEAGASDEASVEAASAGAPEAGEAAPASDVDDTSAEADAPTPGDVTAEPPAAERETPEQVETPETPAPEPVIEQVEAPEPVAEQAAPQEATVEEPAEARAPQERPSQATTPGPSGETASADAEAAQAQGPEGVQAQAEDSAAAGAPAPVDDRPEPTTMAELLAEQPGDIPSLKHGDVVEGKIVRIDKDEMLVDVGAKSEGVVSNRELYGRNAESQPDLKVGETVLVYVLQPESSDGHAVLSVRRAGLERKWRGMQELFDEGVIIDAPVIDHNKGGLIVDCGIRGFVPISQIVDFPRRPQNDQPRDAAQEIAEKLQPYVGRKLRLKILEVNRKANRLILSEKVALYEERREKRDELFSSLQVGQKVTGTVRSIAPFGIFVDLGGIDGLVHKSELSWNKVNNPEGTHDVGDEVEAEVIDINHERGRISLSIRRLLPDPWQSTVADLKVGDIVDGTVTKIVNFGAFVRVKDGLEGLIHISELSHQRVAHPGDVVHEGQTLKLKVISLDSDRHRLGLSLKQAEEAPARPPRERRPRGERTGYDRSQAIQEPEGGIDNTLAAAFAQVRQQIAQQDAGDEGDAGTPQASTSDEDAPDVVTAAADSAMAETASAAAGPITAEDEAPATEEDSASTEASSDIATEDEAGVGLGATEASDETATDEASDETATDEAATEPTDEAATEPTDEASDETATDEAATEPSDETATDEAATEPTDEASDETATDEAAGAEAPSGGDDSDESRIAEEDKA